MFKNFDKVFKFTFKNQTSTVGYRVATLLTTLILFIVPIAIFMIVGAVLKSDDKNLKECGADRIYVVDEENPKADFNALNMLKVDGYTGLIYSNADSVEDALDTIERREETTSLILEVQRVENRLYSRIIIPDSSEIEEDDAKNLEDFVEKAGFSFSVIASGISVDDLTTILKQTQYSVYDTKGYKDGVDLYADKDKAAEQTNAEILPTFNMILTYVAIILIYLVIIMYGNGILQSVVMEKSSKLMDTMLISVSPESLVFGKMLAVLLAGIIQIFFWIAGVVGGLITGVKLYSHFFSDVEGPVIVFLKSLKELGLFKPANIIIGVFALIFGMVLYSSLCAVAGSISSTREEAASNQSIFIFILIISFYLVIFKGINTTDVATWLYLFPFTSAMVLPSGICAGIVSVKVGVLGLAILIACSIVLLVLAGKLYKMMSLYKGNTVNISKALKMLIKNS